jgi:hypothetical protein
MPFSHIAGAGPLTATTALRLICSVMPEIEVRDRLKSIRYRPALIDGFLAQTGLTLEAGPP